VAARRGARREGRPRWQMQKAAERTGRHASALPVAPPLVSCRCAARALVLLVCASVAVVTLPRDERLARGLACGGARRGPLAPYMCRHEIDRSIDRAGGSTLEKRAGRCIVRGERNIGVQEHTT
jgi:hypothetical protein